MTPFGWDRNLTAYQSYSVVQVMKYSGSATRRLSPWLATIISLLLLPLVGHSQNVVPVFDSFARGNGIEGVRQAEDLQTMFCLLTARLDG